MAEMTDNQSKDVMLIVELVSAEVQGMGQIEETVAPLKLDVSYRIDMPEKSGQEETFLVRGEVPADLSPTRLMAQLRKRRGVVGVYSDPRIGPSLTCLNSPALGDSANVQSLLHTSSLRRGHGVYVAVVDTGISKSYLQRQGQNPILDPANGWAPPGSPYAPGTHPDGHGTMCAFDVGLVAPRATLLDYAVLQGTFRDSLSNAIAAYARLSQFMRATANASKPFVVTNSWVMKSIHWDVPPGNPGNYSNNIHHPFNRWVTHVAGQGADVIFAAGNAGPMCPEYDFGSRHPICGANSHPDVLCVGGVDVWRDWVGYSSKGPGRISSPKPDVVGYTHFQGSGVMGPDAGTSASCAVVAGVVAAIRTDYPPNKVSPAALRRALRDTAWLPPRLAPGHHDRYGWGVISPLAALGRLP
jgi:Subtilase family